MKKNIIKILGVFLAVLFTQTAVFSYDLVKSDVECYQGIFMKDDIFLSIPLYTSYEPDSTAVGVVYHITKPTVADSGYVGGDTVKNLGELHKESEKTYYIQNDADNSKYGISYHDGSVSVYSITGGDTAYEGDYVQVSNAGANMSPKNIWLNIPEKDIDVFVNGEKVVFDQTPVIQDDRTLVPVRAIFEALGASVEWESPYVTAQKGTINLRIGIGNSFLTKNGQEIALDVPAQIISDRTLIPLRAVSEALDCNVDWNGETRTVTITD